MMFVFIGSWWRTLRLVMLVFEGYLGLHGGVLLLIVACLLTELVVPAFCTTTDSVFCWAVGLCKESFSFFLLFGDLSPI